MASAAIVGSTGQVGSIILTTLLTHQNVATVAALSRRQLPNPDPQKRLQALIDSDSSKWASDIKALQPVPDIFFSGLGTTRAAVGGFQNQYKIDHDLNLELARAAKEAGAKVYVLISSNGANKSSMFGYPRMKGELEDAVSQLGFEKTIYLQPGLICGEPRAEARLAESTAIHIANFMGKVSGGRLRDVWAQDAEVIARAAVSAGLKGLNGSAPEGKVWILGMSDIIRLGRTEWN